MHINPWAILVSALILWLLGAAWYSPALFAKPWMAMLGIKKENANPKTMMTGMILSFVCDLVLAFILAHFIGWLGKDTFAGGAFVSLHVWLGFIAATALPQGVYENRPYKLFLINTGYWLVGLLIVGGLLAVWR